MSALRSGRSRSALGVVGGLSMGEESDEFVAAVDSGSLGGAENVSFDGARGHGELVGDLPIGQPMRGEQNDLALPIGQCDRRIVGPQRGRVGAGLSGQTPRELRRR